MIYLLACTSMTCYYYHMDAMQRTPRLGIWGWRDTMTTYQATIRHHSISHARTIVINGSLADAKRCATREFGDEQRGYEIVVAEVLDTGDKRIVASRVLGQDRWTNA